MKSRDAAMSRFLREGASTYPPRVSGRAILKLLPIPGAKARVLGEWLLYSRGRIEIRRPYFGLEYVEWQLTTYSRNLLNSLCRQGCYACDTPSMVGFSTEFGECIPYVVSCYLRCASPK